jgi:hypothetical protein
MTGRSTDFGAYTVNTGEHNGVDRPMHAGVADGSSGTPLAVGV